MPQSADNTPYDENKENEGGKSTEPSREGPYQAAKAAPKPKAAPKKK